MAADTLNASSASNPSLLSSRFQIRRLTPEHALWAAALLCHSNVFHSNIFSTVHTRDQCKRFNAGVPSCRYLVDHQINSGLSFGVFDMKYTFQHASSESTGGAFLWDLTNDSGTSAEILSAMDFPLVSVALAYDAIDPLDFARLGPFVSNCLPAFASVGRAVEERSPHNGARQAKERGQVLMRNATATRVDYEGQGLMAGLARFLMREVQLQGFRGVEIVCMADAVTHVWLNPKQTGMDAKIDTEFWSQDHVEEDADGKKTRPFFPAEQKISKIWLQLDV